MDEIRDIVKNIIEDISQKQPQSTEAIQEAWAQAAGPKDAGHTQVREMTSDGALIVHVDTPARLYMLNLKKKSLLDKVRETLPEAQKIYLKTGKVNG